MTVVLQGKPSFPAPKHTPGGWCSHPTQTPLQSFPSPGLHKLNSPSLSFLETQVNLLFQSNHGRVSEYLPRHSQALGLSTCLAFLHKAVSLIPQPHQEGMLSCEQAQWRTWALQQVWSSKDHSASPQSHLAGGAASGALQDL